MAMAKKPIDSSKVAASGKNRARYSTKVPNVHPGSTSQKCTPNNKKGESPLQRVSPVRGQSRSPQNTGSSLRTSPGLLAGHYAGCKFSEPPLPSALPLPPQHWMQATQHSVRLSFHPTKSDHIDVENQLKVLLKVQA